MDGSRRMVLLLGVSLLTSLAGCHGRFLVPPPPGYAYGAHPGAGGAYGPYGECVTGGYGSDDYYVYGASGPRGYGLRENLMARRDQRLANRQSRYPGHRRTRRQDRQGMHGDIGCDTCFDVGCDGSGMCDLGGACDSCDGCTDCGMDCGIDCCDPCMSCSSCGCGGTMMCGTNPGPYIAYLIPMESYQGEIGGGMCCDPCDSGVMEGGCPCEFGDAGTCAGGSCQSYPDDDQHWMNAPEGMTSPDTFSPGSEPQPIHTRPRETLPAPPSGNSNEPAEGNFQPGSSDSAEEPQANYLPLQHSQWVPSQF